MEEVAMSLCMVLNNPGEMYCDSFDCNNIFFLIFQFSSVQFTSFTQLCPTLCDPMNHSTPGLFYFTILYWFCHTLTWIHHRCTWVPNLELPSHLPPYHLSRSWIRKLWYIYTMEYYSAIKKNTFESVLMRWMKLELIIQS